MKLIVYDWKHLFYFYCLWIFLYFLSLEWLSFKKNLSISDDNSTTILIKILIKICKLNLDSPTRKVIFQNGSTIELHSIFVKESIKYLDLFSL